MPSHHRPVVERGRTQLGDRHVRQRRRPRHLRGRDRASGGLRGRRRREVALRRGRRRAADRAAARLPGVLVQLAAADRAPRRGGISRRRTRHARLQPVIAAGRRGGVLRRPAGRRRPRAHPRTRWQVGAAGRP
ncbi:MAG: hypothetical protein AVDCRST_MAG67-1878 [uncultured Solirubrobacteraceae bacterium]|uniref:Uncharacterized protein n=1 Tax=uncultured Solirubrobacteraceae bacterium TaxID=1162706 RepID=A0A6J4SP35_9ACTN|nr:MAG: hypothetical protein AVDCRST_MAG67-1878 [uncultured Solirubrobacteraceae bacterium]